MASGLYEIFKEDCLSRATGVDIDTDTIAVLPVADEDYTVDLALHEDLADVTTYTGATKQTITPKTVTDGAFDSTGAPVFSSLAVDATKDVDALFIFKDTGVAATSIAIAYIDLTTAVRPNGGDITVNWDTSPSYIFAI
jgi:hypothetical protein